MTELDPQIDVSSVAALVLAVWRSLRRAKAAAGTPETVLRGIENALDQAVALGFRGFDPTGQSYNDQMRITVIDDLSGHDESAGDRQSVTPVGPQLRSGASCPKIIVDCLTPAVYYQDRLILPAEVIIGCKEKDE